MSAAQNLVSIERPGDVLSPSQASGFLSCSAAWAFKYILKLADPPTGARTQGSAIHEALGANFAQKIDTKRDLPAAGVQAIYRKAWDDLVSGNVPSRHGKPALPTEFRPDEDPDTLKAQGEALTLKYLDEAAPSIDPAAVELPVVGRIGEVLTRGYIDLLDVKAESPPGSDNLLLIRINYRIRANNAVGNLVYPFYITEAA